MNRTTNNWLLSTGVRLDTSDIQRQLDQVASQFHLDLRNASVDDFTNSMRDLTQEMRNVDQETDNVNEHTQELGLTYQEANLIMRKCVDTISDMIERVTELDSALTDFKKVSDLSGESLDAYVDKLSDMGAEVGRTATAMVQGATEFRKNGFNDEDSAQLAQISEMFRNVADEEISSADAASFIISQLIAFRDTLDSTMTSAEQAQAIIDSVNQVANRFSVSSGQLSQALGIVASTSSAVGNSMSETLGMLTAITEQTRNASKSARGLNTIFSRLTQVLDEESATGQKLTKIYDDLNIALYDSEGQMRSTYDILGDLAGKWNGLSKNEQEYIALTSAGANQLNNFLALMNNFNHAIEANETAINSQGSALRENARYMESIEAKVNALDAAFEKLSSEVAPTSVIKLGLDAITLLLKGLSTPIGSSITQFSLLTGTILGLGTVATNVGSKILGMIRALTGATTAANVMNPALLATSVALGAIITVAIKAYDAWTDYKQEQEEITKGAKQLKDAIDDANSSYADSKTKIEATAEAAKEWMKRVEELTNKTSLNADEQYELNELVKRLNENIPNLGLEIDKVTGKIKGETTEIYNQIEAWKKLAIEQGLSEKISKQSSALGEAQIGRQEAILQRKDLIASIGGQSAYENAIGLMQKYESSKIVDTEKVADFFGLEYSSEAKKLGFKSARDMYNFVKQIENLDKSISAYDKEIKDAEAGLRSIERTRDAMLGIDVRAQDQKEIAGSGEVAFGEETVSGASSQGVPKPNLGQIAKEQKEVTQVLEKSFEEQYKDLKHNLTMDYIAEKEYYDSLEKLYKSFYEEGTEDYQKYEEEVYKGRKKLLEDEQSAKEKAESEAQRAAEKAKTEAERAAKEAERQAEKEQKAIEEAKQAAKAAYEKGFTDQLDTLEHKLAMDEITEEEYYTTLDALNQKFFKDKEEYLDKYWKYEEKIYSYRKKLAEQEQKEQEKALEDFKKLQEERIKALKDEVEAYNDLIKEQLDTLKSTEDAINDKYDAELAKLNETNEALEQQIEYEKMLEELARAKNTRKLVYSEGGYKYVEDTDAIASAQSKIDAYNRSKDLEAQKKALAWDRDLQLGAVADRRSALQAQQERWSNLSSLLGGVDSSMGDVDIIELMKANSASWGTATSTEEKEKLHEANLILNELLSEKGAFNSASGRWSMYADGTTSATGGLSLVGEQGAELRVLNHGDGIIPSGLTKNLMAWGAFDPKALMGVLGGGSTSINISNISLPNVSNAQEFLQGIQALATQYTFQRG